MADTKSIKYLKEKKRLLRLVKRGFWSIGEDRSTKSDKKELEEMEKLLEDLN